jgi:2-amino-4-hydroxy-6-hydroxymethyldihydropteridine diphosphokinase
MVVPVGIALGSNLGNRSAELDAGIAFLRELSGNGELRESPRMETIPVDCPPGSPPFLNSVAEIYADSVMMPPLKLLRCLQAFELQRGRAPFREVNSPRPIDLDIIYYGAECFDQLDLIIPHPRAHERIFVLEPLSHLRPNYILPGLKKTVASLLTELRNANA